MRTWREVINFASHKFCLTPDRKLTGFCNSESDPDRTEFRKTLYRIRCGWSNYVDHCSQMFNRRFFRI